MRLLMNVRLLYLSLALYLQSVVKTIYVAILASWANENRESTMSQRIRGVTVSLFSSQKSSLPISRLLPSHNHVFERRDRARCLAAVVKPSARSSTYKLRMSGLWYVATPTRHSHSRK